MLNPRQYKNKKVTVIGFARSGLACANLLHRLGAFVCVTDIKDDEQTRLNATRLCSQDISLELGIHTPCVVKGRDLIVVSPGIPDEAMPLVWAKEFGVPVIGEIEFAWSLCPAKVIAVTGSNGKTTVTTLIGKVLEKKGKRVFVCGNIGNPFSGEVEKMREGDFVSLEISSFQLEKITTFRPAIAVLLNFSRNHLDRYKGMEEYLRAKKRIFLNQQEQDYLVLNRKDPSSEAVQREARSRIVYFNQDAGVNPNQSAVMAVGSLLGIENELMREVFSEFKGVEHRMELVAEIRRVRFINDSKATTVDSALWALRSIPGRVILIAGGKDKGNDYRIILEAARQKVKHAVLIGQAKEKMKLVFQGQLPFDEALSLPEAVRKAYALAEAGDSVLLSPMCASFDMFTDYEHRGRVFKQAVGELEKS
ncbi:MAG: UDP-N-acetylmuramoyl-L-alanine--D-glutamate ligase [Candidatus Omnitrophota bacterium]